MQEFTSDLKIRHYTSLDREGRSRLVFRREIIPRHSRSAPWHNGTCPFLASRGPRTEIVLKKYTYTHRYTHAARTGESRQFRGLRNIALRELTQSHSSSDHFRQWLAFAMEKYLREDLPRGKKRHSRFRGRKTHCATSQVSRNRPRVPPEGYNLRIIIRVI